MPLYGIGGLGDLAATRELLPHAQLETCYKVRHQTRVWHATPIAACSAPMLGPQPYLLPHPPPPALTYSPTHTLTHSLTHSHTHTLTHTHRLAHVRACCCQGRLLLAMSVEECPQPLPPKVKSIGPCNDPPHETYVVRFDLNQAQLQ